MLKQGDIMRFAVIILFFVFCLFWGCGKKPEEALSPEQIHIQEDWNVQPLLNNIHEVIQKAVGAGISDQIPGIHRADDILTVSVGGVECAQHIRTVQEAALLLRTNMVSQFKEKMIGSMPSEFPPDKETVLPATLETEAWVINVDTLIFKRTSKRVILVPVYVARKKDKNSP